MKNINYFFDKDDKPIDRMESLMYLIASMTSMYHKRPLGTCSKRFVLCSSKTILLLSRVLLNAMKYISVARRNGNTCASVY